MRELLAITRALGDATRVRALMTLRGVELCLCQLIDVLGLAPSTVSRHMTVLYEAGLVERRKEGRWHYYRLAGEGASPTACRALQWAQDALADEPLVQRDAADLCCVRGKALQEAAACYRKWTSTSCEPHTLRI